jgi:ABC-type nitrate/sulfonate/bicarbonate transport system substrate-binding protein
MHVAINRKLAHPAAVRSYLRGLQETTRYANARKSVAAFQAEVASRFQMEQGDVRDVLSNTIYLLSDLDPDTLLSLWEREAAGLRKGR